MIRDTSATDFVLDTRPAWQRHWWTAAIAVGIVVLLAWLWPKLSNAQSQVHRQDLRIATVSIAPFTADLNAQDRVVASRSPTLYAPALEAKTTKVPELGFGSAQSISR